MHFKIKVVISHQILCKFVVLVHHIGENFTLKIWMEVTPVANVMYTSFNRNYFACKKASRLDRLHAKKLRIKVFIAYLALKFFPVSTKFCAEKGIAIFLKSVHIYLAPVKIT